MFAAGLCCKVWFIHEINYLHIFRVEHKYKIIAEEFWQLALLLSAIWSFALYMKVQHMDTQ